MYFLNVIVSFQFFFINLNNSFFHTSQLVLFLYTPDWLKYICCCYIPHHFFLVLQYVHGTLFQLCFFSSLCCSLLCSSPCLHISCMISASLTLVITKVLFTIFFMFAFSFSVISLSLVQFPMTSDHLTQVILYNKHLPVHITIDECIS